MADRFLREGLIRSDRYNQVSLDARDLFVRLLMIADDFGCYDGRENVIAHNAYYHGRNDPLPLNELHQAGLLVRYTNASKPFIGLMQWSESLRLKRTFPAPPVNNDRHDAPIRGKFGRPVSWRNPMGSDPVSILIGTDGRPVAPQPQEWRRVDGDWSPITRAAAPQPPVTRASVLPPPSQSLPQVPVIALVTEPNDTPHVTSDPVPQDTCRNVEQERLRERELEGQNLNTKVLKVVETNPSDMPQRLDPPPPPNGSGKIDFQGGEWTGISDALLLRWRATFGIERIAQQLERAGAWLKAHDKERAAIEADAGYEAFLIRWLLQESRGGTNRAKGHVDA